MTLVGIDSRTQGVGRSVGIEVQARYGRARHERGGCDFCKDMLATFSAYGGLCHKPEHSHLRAFMKKLLDTILEAPLLYTSCRKMGGASSEGESQAEVFHLANPFEVIKNG